MKRNLYIALGGTLGALARYGMKMWPLLQNPWNFPVHTLLTNLTGCFLIAAFLTAANDYLEIDGDLRVGIATGFIGAFTTFSTLCREAGQMIGSGDMVIAASYGLFSLVLGFGSVYLGVFTARKVLEMKDPDAAKGDKDRGEAV